MKILASAGKQRSSEADSHVETPQATNDQASKDDDNDDVDDANDVETKVDSEAQQRGTQEDTNPQNVEADERLDEAEDCGLEIDADEEELPTTDDLTAILNSLTGIPLPDDVLLYAVPICAPYSTMTNYKFKVAYE